MPLPRPGAASYTDDPGFELDLLLDAYADAIEAAPQKIAEVSGNGTSSVLEFASIPATFRSLHLTVVGRTSAAVTSTPVLLTFESTPTAGAYNRQLMRGNAAAASASESVGASNIYIGAMTGATGPANTAGAIDVVIPEYSGTSFFKTVFARQLEVDGLTAGNFWLEIFGGLYEATSAITRVRLTLTAGNWSTGSRATLYGLPA